MENVVHEPQMSPGVGDPPTGMRRGAASIGGTSGARRSRSRAFGAALAVGVGVTALAAAPSSALAAEDCPNAAVRAQQGVQHLPNCLAYEKVTPNDKNGAMVQPDSPIADDGSAISVWSNFHMFDDVPGVQQLGSAFREADGWKIRILTNSEEWGKRRVTATGTNDVAWHMGVSDDLRSLMFRTFHPVDPADLGSGNVALGMNTPDLYIQRVDGSRSWVSAPVSGAVPAGVQPGGAVHPAPWGTSSDLSRVVFDATRVIDPAVDPTVRQHVWLWQEGRTTELVDRLPDGSISTGTVVSGSASSVNRIEAGKIRTALGGRRVVFESSTLHGRTHVYARIDAGTPDARTVLVSASQAGAPCSVTPTFQHITENGRYVRFACAAQLTPDAPVGGGSYVRDLDEGTVEYDDPMVDRGSDPVVAKYGIPWTRPEGTFQLTSTALAGVPVLGDPSGQLARVDLATGTAVCVSCPLDGRPAAFPSEPKGGLGYGAGGGAGESTRGTLTAEGDVVFKTVERLVPEDTNAFADLYMWKDGKHYLLTAGTAADHVIFGGVSLDGSTISFATPSSLVSEDEDGNQQDIYVLKRNGGFYREASATECTSGCQGPAVPAVPLAAPLSLAFPAAGDAEDDAQDPIVVSGSRSVRGASTKVRVRVPGAGRVTVSGSGLRSATRSLSKASTATLTVKLSERAQRTLRRKGSVKVSSSVRFVPSSGDAQRKRVSLTFRKKAAKKKGSSRGVAAASNGKAAR